MNSLSSVTIMDIGLIGGLGWLGFAIGSVIAGEEGESMGLLIGVGISIYLIFFLP
jgi:hypothetical protein